MKQKTNKHWCSADRAKRKAVALLTEEGKGKGMDGAFYYFMIDNEPFLTVDLTVSAADDENYKEELFIFKTLFNSDDPDMKKALWNALYPVNPSDSSVFRAGDFSDEELAFLQEHYSCFEQRVNPFRENANKEFSTERLVLRPYNNQKNEKTYRKYLRGDGDYSLFCCEKPTRDELDSRTHKDILMFSVFVKQTNTMVGVVELNGYNRIQRRAFACWYIFKPYRNNGYAKEAFTELARRGFEGKLIELKKSSWEYKYIKQRVMIDFIVAEVRVTNIPSQKTAQSCGFKFHHKDRNFFIVEDKYAEDAYVYELTPETIA